MAATYATNSNSSNNSSNNSSSKAAITKQRQGEMIGGKNKEEGQKGVEVASVLCVREAPPKDHYLLARLFPELLQISIIDARDLRNKQQQQQQQQQQGSNNKTAARGNDRRKEQEEGQKGVEAASVLCVREAPRRTIISWPESLQIDQQLLCSCSPLPGPRKTCRCRGLCVVGKWPDPSCSGYLGKRMDYSETQWDELEDMD
ncbi:hypothetical protein CEXT_230031 [Caerostris extrusa]|uniref:Uncharacterized protein n=1 Tax=Caerostris extrusa TaxID=172846 RepID=A0AAV4UJ46_CAEEX|nr:hypothetical protein CEXT_230031 [Caerostris extrusa]